MKIQQFDLSVRDLVAGFSDDGDGGVGGHGGAPRHPKLPFVKRIAIV